MTCPKCGAWMVASELAAATGFLRCGVCTHIYLLPTRYRFGRASRLARFATSAVVGAVLVGILVSITRVWLGDYWPGLSIKQALPPSVAPLVPEGTTFPPESDMGVWHSENGPADASFIGGGQEGDAQMARQRNWQPGGLQQLDGSAVR
jgi:hypothetical protein